MARSLAGRDSLPDQLRRLIVDSGMSHYALGKAAGVDPRQIDRFSDSERDLTLETAGKLAAALGVELVRRRGRGRQAASRAPAPPAGGSLACGD